MKKYKISKGDVFLCIEDYIMDDGEKAYTKGKEYISELNGCITDNRFDVKHQMEDLNYFYEHFKELGKHNNGWIRIESESDLPKTNGKNETFWFVTIHGNIKTNGYNDKSKNQKKAYLKVYTHYQPIEKPSSPIY